MKELFDYRFIQIHSDLFWTYVILAGNQRLRCLNNTKAKFVLENTMIVDSSCKILTNVTLFLGEGVNSLLLSSNPLKFSNFSFSLNVLILLVKILNVYRPSPYFNFLSSLQNNFHDLTCLAPIQRSF